MTLSMIVKEKLTLDMSRYDFECVCQRKKEKLILDMFKYDFECVCQRKSWL
jgi:hypothetical protein